LVLLRTSSHHLHALAPERLPHKPLRRHSQLGTRIVELQNLTVALPLLAYASRPSLAKPHTVPRSAPFEDESVTRIGELIQIAWQPFPPQRATHRKAQASRRDALPACLQL